MTIEDYVPSDMDYIFEKEQTFVADYGESACLSKDQLHEFYTKFKNAFVIFIAKNEDENLGYIMFSWNGSEWYLNTMYTEPKHRRTGVMTKLFAKMTEYLSKYKNHSLRAETLNKNEISKVFLEKNGFKFLKVDNQGYKDIDQLSFIYIKDL